MTEPERDLTVAAALLGVRAPEHGDSFWDRLDHKLAETEMAASRAAVARHAGPGISDPAELERVTIAPAAIARLHRTRPHARSRPALLGAVAALIALVGFAVTRAGDGSGPGDERARDGGSVTTVPALAPKPVGPMPPTTLLPVSPEPVDPEAAAGDWLAAVAKGDTERAWNLLGATSRTRMGGYDRFAATMPELAKSYGDWDRSLGAKAYRFALAGDNDALFVVTPLRETLAGPSPIQPLPVRLVAPATFRVEPFAADDGDMITFTRPDEAAGPHVMRRDEPIEASVPAGAGQVVIAVDGGPPETVVVEPIGKTAVAKLTYSPKGGWIYAHHVVTLAYVGKGGSVAVRAIVFDITGA
jgi:hypothetical protein